jgi:hypothetical protein
MLTLDVAWSVVLTGCGLTLVVLVLMHPLDWLFENRGKNNEK